MFEVMAFQKSLELQYAALSLLKTTAAPESSLLMLLAKVTRFDLKPVSFSAKLARVS